MTGCQRCAARQDPERWFKSVLPADIKEGVEPEVLKCASCGDALPLFGRVKFIEHNKLFSRWLQLHYRELPSWLIPCHVAVQLSHGLPVDNYIRHLAWGD